MKYCGILILDKDVELRQRKEYYIMQNQMNKRSTAFPALYIAVVALVVIVGIIYNDSVDATVMERYGEAAPAGGLIFELLYGAILMIPAYFLLQHKKLKWCVLFILIGAMVLFVWEHNWCSFIMNNELEHSSMLQRGLFLMNVVLILGFIPSIVFSAAILWANDKKVFTALTIVATVVAVLVSLDQCPVILFMGLAIRNDFDILLQERTEAKKK